MSDAMWTTVAVTLPEQWNGRSFTPDGADLFDPDLVAERLAEAEPLDVFVEGVRDALDSGGREMDVGGVGDEVVFSYWSKYQSNALHVGRIASLITGLEVTVIEEWHEDEPSTETTTFVAGKRTEYSVDGRNEVVNFEGELVPLDLAKVVAIANSPSHLAAWLIRATIRELLFRLGEDVSAIKEP